MAVLIDDELAEALDDPTLLWLYVRCSLRAQRSNPAGSFSFSYRVWAEQLDLSKSKLERSLKQLESLRLIKRDVRQGKATVTMATPMTCEEPKKVARDSGGTGSEGGDGTVKPKRFTPPCAGEVGAYAHKIGVVLDAEHFVDHYTSKGWRVGSHQMKDWKAAVRNWARRSSDFTKPGGNDHDPRGNLAVRQRVLEGLNGDGEAA